MISPKPFSNILSKKHSTLTSHTPLDVLRLTPPPVTSYTVQPPPTASSTKLQPFLSGDNSNQGSFPTIAYDILHFPYHFFSSPLPPPTINRWCPHHQTPPVTTLHDCYIVICIATMGRLRTSKCQIRGPIRTNCSTHVDRELVFSLAGVIL